MSSLTALPVHCCSTVYRRGVTDLISYPCNIASKADSLSRKITAGTYAFSVTRQRYRGVVKSSTYRSATTKCTGKVIRQTNCSRCSTLRLRSLVRRRVVRHARHKIPTDVNGRGQVRGLWQFALTRWLRLEV